MGRIAESIRSLNSLSCSTATNTRRASFPFGQQTKASSTSTQNSCLSRISGLVRGGGTCPTGLTPKLAFEEVIKSKDMYSLESCAVAPYDISLLKVAKTDTVPKPATRLLPPVEANYIDNPEQFIVRTPEEIDRWVMENPNFQPYWDETLRSSQEVRYDLYRRLAEKSLLGFRKRIKAKVGLFFVWKSQRKGIRLIVDARMANACHR